MAGNTFLAVRSAKYGKGRLHDEYEQGETSPREFIRHNGNMKN